MVKKEMKEKNLENVGKSVLSFSNYMAKYCNTLYYGVPHNLKNTDFSWSHNTNYFKHPRMR